jgi:hypothetical protein
MSTKATRRRRARERSQSAPAQDIIGLGGGSVTVEAATDQTDGPRRFEMLAYSGGSLHVSGYPLPVVVDLEGMETPDKTPVRLRHNPDHRFGHADQLDKSGGQLRASGLASGATVHTQEVLDSHDQGFPWQVSIGVRPKADSLELVGAGRKAQANGQEFDGPIYVARKSRLLHFGVLDDGADSNTTLSIAAQAATKEKAMTFDEFLASLGGLTADELQPNQLAVLEAAFSGNTAGDDGENVTPAVIAAEAAPAFDLPKLDAAHTTSLVSLETAVAKHPNELAGQTILAEAKEKLASLRSTAAANEWPAVAFEARAMPILAEAEVAVIRAERPAGPAIHSSTHDGRPEVIEAALGLTAGLPDPEKHFDEKTLEAAHKQYRRLGLQQAILAAAANNGYSARPAERIHDGNIRSVMEHAFPPRSLPTIEAGPSGFSATDLAGILSNLANKSIKSGFAIAEQTWREVASVGPVNNFQIHTRYRMTASMEYEEVPPGGTIPHGTLGEETHTVQAKTYAKMIGITYQDIINDDLGVFDQLRRKLGLGSVQKIAKVFWTLWINNSAFFTAARGNYQEGAATALGEAGLNTAVQLFRDMKDTDGNRLGISPDRIIVPSTLEATGKKWHQSTHVEDTTASTLTPTANIYTGKYRPVTVPELNDSDFTGYSTLAWYLLAKPAAAATAEMVFLFGQESPTIESSAADFNTLGIQMRGVHSFGVAFAEYRAGVKSKGEA